MGCGEALDDRRAPGAARRRTEAGARRADPGGGKLRDIAGEVLDIANAGLAARARFDASGSNETGFLDPLREIVRSGKVPAQVLLDKYHGAWGGDVSKVYDELRF